MKTITATLVALAIWATPLSAQDTLTLTTKDTTFVNAGFMLAPQGGLRLDKLDAGFQQTAPFFAVVPIIKGKMLYTPFYSITYNAYGVAIERAVTKNIGAYIVGTKSIHANLGYVGAGFDIPVGNKIAAGFIEFGSLWNEYTPTLYLGAFIPLTRGVWKIP